MSDKSMSYDEGKINRGIFIDGPVQGLEYETRTVSGITNEKGEFEYRTGETVTFSVGGLVLGTAPGKDRITPVDLVIESSGEIDKITLKKVTNIARFLQSLDIDGDVENGITITDSIRNTVKHYKYAINFEQSEDDFSADSNVQALFAELNLKLRSPAQARNQLRRTLMGIKKMTDTRIPTRDGSYLLADIYLPIKEGKYPAILALGAHGKVLLGTMGMSYASTEENMLKFEAREDRFFEGNPENLTYVENHGAANTVDWVPEGYVLVKIDERGVGESPGMFEQFSLQEAKDFYDSIEWAAKQPWCNGKVGTWGFSYWAMTQWNMAQLQPPSLKAMIPVFGSTDSYREYIYNGGVFTKTAHTVQNSSGEWQGVDWVDVAQANPFYDPDIYGPMGNLCISPDLGKITVPLWVVMPLEYFSINIVGSSEGYIHSASKYKKLTIAGDYWGAWPYSKEAFSGFKDFFDYWLKDIKTDIMEQPPVKMMIRTGGGGYYWKSENEWPVARTSYKHYYLDASPSSWTGDGKRHDFMKLSPTIPEEERKKSYSAEVNIGIDPPWSHGVSFVTEPLPEDIVIAGYLKLVMWVSSSSSDMDIVASLRVVDEDNAEVPYAMTYSYSGCYHPLSIGWLKVSHRKLDPEKSTVYRPYHTHLEADYQPLQSNEIVPVEVEIWPTTALIKHGKRLRLDVQPTDGYDHPAQHVYDETYHKGAVNNIYTGPDHPSYLQLPLIPPE